MHFPSQEENSNKRQDSLLAILERLQELPGSAIHFVLDQAIQQIQDVLAADLVAFLFHDTATDTLVARHGSHLLGRQQQAKGIQHLSLANGGNTVEVFLSGVPFLTGHTVPTSHEPPDAITNLGMRSQMAVVFRVQTQHRGIVLAASTRTDSFTTQDLRFLEAIARWIGLVIGRNELVEQMQQHEFISDQKQVTEQLLTIMAHELRNYLQPLQGRLEMLIKRARQEEREKDTRDLESSLHTLDLLSRSVSDVVDIARLNQGLFALTPVPMNLSAVVQDVMKSFAIKPLALSMRAPAEVFVSADPQRIRQALETMMLYVVNTSFQAEEITIEIAIEGRNDGSWVRLRITGRGSPSSRIGQHHAHSADNSDFTRLGVQLYLTNQIALAHLGTFTITSATDHECQLTLAFPVEEEDLIVHGDDELRVIV